MAQTSKYDLFERQYSDLVFKIVLNSVLNMLESYPVNEIYNFLKSL